MNLFNEVFEKNLKINRVNKPDEKVDRTLVTIYNELEKLYGKDDLKKAVLALKTYMNTKFYKK